MTADNELQQSILDELRDEPSVDAAQIGVAVEKGVVSLTGSVATYAEKLLAEDTVKRVFGVRAVANDITVKLRDGHARTDPELAKATVARPGADRCSAPPARSAPADGSPAIPTGWDTDMALDSVRRGRESKFSGHF